MSQRRRIRADHLQEFQRGTEEFIPNASALFDYVLPSILLEAGGVSQSPKTLSQILEVLKWKKKKAAC